MKTSIATKNLLEVAEIFTKYKIEFWLDLGTLLGIIRNGDLIKWDSDVDLGMWYDTINRNEFHLAIQELRKKGFLVRIDNFKIALTKDDIPINILFSRIHGDKAWAMGSYNGSKLIKLLAQIVSNEFRIYLPENCRMKWNLVVTMNKIMNLISRSLREQISKLFWTWWHLSGGKRIKRVVPKEYYTNLDSFEFKGKRFKIPSKTEKYLEYRYGKDWRKPKKEYKHWIEDGAIDKNGSF